MGTSAQKTHLDENTKEERNVEKWRFHNTYNKEESKKHVKYGNSEWYLQLRWQRDGY